MSRIHYLDVPDRPVNQGPAFTSYRRHRIMSRAPGPLTPPRWVTQDQTADQIVALAPDSEPQAPQTLDLVPQIPPQTQAQTQAQALPNIAAEATDDFTARAKSEAAPYMQGNLDDLAPEGPPSGTQPQQLAQPQKSPMPNADYFSKRFGLTERPFTLLPDPDFLFWTQAHSRAFAVLEYGVMARAPITVITGEVGAGKTTLLQHLLKHFDEDVLVGLISNAQGGRGDLLNWAMGALDIDAPEGADYVAKHQAMQSFLIEQYAEGRRVVLIIDEAQNISVEGLEELRMLTNINSGKDELLQLILVGQPELRDIITRPELRQFAQRVSASFHLPAMDLETTKAYVRHRLTHAGGTGQEFNDGAIALIHKHSGGVPRLVNKFAEFAMVYAATSDHPFIDELSVLEIFRDNLFLHTFETETQRNAAE